MTRTELVSMAAERTKMTKKDTDKVLSELLAIMSEALAKGDRVQFVGFGTFEVREKAARTAKNPRTGEPVQIEACRVPAFKPGKQLKEQVNRRE